jgi:hypothetical protein
MFCFPPRSVVPDPPLVVQARPTAPCCPGPPHRTVPDPPLVVQARPTAPCCPGPPHRTPAPIPAIPPPLYPSPPALLLLPSCRQLPTRLPRRVCGQPRSAGPALRLLDGPMCLSRAGRGRLGGLGDDLRRRQGGCQAAHGGRWGQVWEAPCHTKGHILFVICKHDQLSRSSAHCSTARPPEHEAVGRPGRGG